MSNNFPKTILLKPKKKVIIIDKPRQDNIRFQGRRQPNINNRGVMIEQMEDLNCRMGDLTLQGPESRGPESIHRGPESIGPESRGQEMDIDNPLTEEDVQYYYLPENREKMPPIGLILQNPAKWRQVVRDNSGRPQTPRPIFLLPMNTKDTIPYEWYERKFGPWV